MIEYVADFFRADRDFTFPNGTPSGTEILDIRSPLFLHYKIDTANDLDVYIGTHPEKPKKSCIRLKSSGSSPTAISRITMERPQYNGVYVIGMRVRWDSTSAATKVKNLVGILLGSYAVPSMEFEDGITYSVEYCWVNGSYALYIDGTVAYSAGSPTMFIPKIGVGNIIAGDDAPLSVGIVTITDIYCATDTLVNGKDKREYLQGPFEVEHYTPVSVENAEAWKVVDGTKYAVVKNDKTIIEALAENTMRADPKNQRNVMTGPKNNVAIFRFDIPATGDILGYLQSAALRKPDGQSGNVTFELLNESRGRLANTNTISANTAADYTRVSPRQAVSSYVTNPVVGSMEVYKN